MRRDRGFVLVALGIPALAIAVAAGLLGDGPLARAWEYYRLPAQARVAHPDHALLRSSGGVGLLCAVAGTALFLVNLLYLLRKRLLALKWLGSLRAWMRLHVASGLLAALLILFHSGFVATSALGSLALAGLGIVIVTGLAGRYIYAFVPRASDGRELDATELRTRVTGLRRELAAGGIATSLLDEGSPLVAAPETGFLGRLLGVIAGSRAARRDFARLKAEVRSHPHLAAHARRLLPAARSFYEDRQRLSRLHELRALLGSWRFLHRWLAIVMIVLAVFHIAIAVEYGELWILGGRP